MYIYIVLIIFISVLVILVGLHQDKLRVFAL